MNLGRTTRVSIKLPMPMRGQPIDRIGSLALRLTFSYHHNRVQIWLGSMMLPEHIIRQCFP